MARIFSGIQPTGDLHLGNLLGAIKGWVAQLDEHDAVYCIVDLHALTVPHDPAELRENTLSMTALLMAAGLDPNKCILFAQSAVAEHTQLAWLMECTISFGELRRMTQFKDKSEKADFISAGLFSYPALQAADILLYDTDIVPVGEDQRQHIELTRNAAERFNSRFGETFILPEHQIPPAGAKVMDLQDPTRKMSKSSAKSSAKSFSGPEGESSGVIFLLDSPDVIQNKIKRAVTDSEPEVVYDPEKKPGVSNLLEIIATLENTDPKGIASKYQNYKELKEACAESLVAALAPIQERYQEISSAPESIQASLTGGAEKAGVKAKEVLARARSRVGL